MTHPPSTSSAPNTHTASNTPSAPNTQGTPSSPSTRNTPSAGSSRAPRDPRVPPSTLADAAAHLRAAATTEPGRLQVIGAVLAVLVLAFGAVTALEVSQRAGAADDVVERSQPLSADAALVYRSLADADTAASSGFLAGAVKEPRAVRERYEQDVARASQLLVKAATHADGRSESGRHIATLNEQLPIYTGHIETARAYNRQGLPLGGAYLRFANEQMTKVLLPAAQKLYDAETARLDRDDEDARSWPLLSVLVGLAALGALGWAQRRNFLRTNRVFNHGLLAASAACAVVLLWLVVAQTVAAAQLGQAQASGQQSLKVLNDARISALKARANENLVLVSRGAVLTDDGKQDKYETEYAQHVRDLVDDLGRAQRLADDAAGRRPVESATEDVDAWQERHRQVSETDRGGEYERAVEKVIGAKGSTGQSFDEVDAALDRALAHEQREFTRAAENGRGALGVLPVGAVTLGVAGALGAVLGINRRLSEYR